MVIEKLLQFLISEIDAELLKAIKLQKEIKKEAFAPHLTMVRAWQNSKKETGQMFLNLKEEKSNT